MNSPDQRWRIAFSRLVDTSSPDPKPRRGPPFNANPKGVVQRGGGAHLVFEYLAECPGRAFTAGQIQAFTGLSRPAVSWGLYYLSRQGLIETLADPRNSRYHRYVAQKSEVAIKVQCTAEDCE